MSKLKRAFTLIELMIVIGIIAVILPVSMLAYTNMRRQAHAAKILSDFRKIETAWKLWKVDNGNYLLEDVYDTDNRECTIVGGPDEPTLFNSNPDRTTGLYDARGLANWKGPYLEGIIRDPFGRQYSYDYDSDDAGDPLGGVNIVLPFCGRNERYEGIPEILDRQVDNSDGAATGRIRWESGAGSNSMMGYHLADTPTE